MELNEWQKEVLKELESAKITKNTGKITKHTGPRICKDCGKNCTFNPIHTCFVPQCGTCNKDKIKVKGSWYCKVCP